MLTRTVIFHSDSPNPGLEMQEILLVHWDPGAELYHNEQHGKSLVFLEFFD
jgi:hypothetical protein